MAKFKAPSAAVLTARAKKAGRAGTEKARIQWFIKEVLNKHRITMRGRMFLAVSLLRDKTSKNISRPVTKGKAGRVTNRSKPGEFPKAETTQLLLSIFSDVRTSRSQVIEGFVGTPLDYGVILETSKRLDRPFLVRTLNEEMSTIRKILTGPIR